MKHYIALGLLSAFALASCNEDPTYYELPDQPDQMHIKASVEDIEFSKSMADQPAITFSWDAAVSPVNASDEVTYGIRFYETPRKLEHMSDLIELGNVTQCTFTHDQLNSIVSRWVLPGEQTEVTAQLLAIVHNEQRYVKPIQSLVSFTAVPYEKYPTKLYMHIIDEAAGTERIEPMEQRTLGTGIYELNLTLKPCSYYFSTSGEQYPLYGQSETDNEKLQYVTEGNFSPFINSAVGPRTIIVDTNEPYNDCRVLNIVQLPVPGQIWICGDGCSVGWNTNTSSGHMEMVGSAREPYYYAWTGDFNAGGEIKIGLGNGWGDNFFYAPEERADPLIDHRLFMYRLQDNGGDVKWVPTVSGRYTFTLCLLADDMWTKFEPAN